MEARHQKLKDKRVIYIWIGIIVAIIISMELTKAEAMPLMPFVNNDKTEVVAQGKKEISSLSSHFSNTIKTKMLDGVIELISKKGI